MSGNSVVIGASGEDSNATGLDGNQSDNGAADSGAAYVFVRSGTSWSQQAYLKASNTGTNDQFGGSVAASGDTVVVGGWQEDSNAVGANGNQSDNSATDSGAAYVFVRNGTNWAPRGYLKASNTGAGDDFGIAVAVSGETVVVGADLEDSNATTVNGNQIDNSASDAGAAYLFTIPPRLDIEQFAVLGLERVFWARPASGFVLEVASALNGPPVTGWSTVPVGSYQTNTTHIFITVPMPTGQKFYRLRQP